MSLFGSSPSLGHLWLVAQVSLLFLTFFKPNDPHFPERLEVICDLSKYYPRIYRLMMGPFPKLFVTDPELVKQVFTSTKCLKKPAFYRFFGWGAGLATAPGTFRLFWFFEYSHMTIIFTLQLIHGKFIVDY